LRAARALLVTMAKAGGIELGQGEQAAARLALVSASLGSAGELAGLLSESDSGVSELYADEPRA
jgi:hypothetical protein